MNNSHCILFTIVAAFTGFLLGYSVPAMIEIGSIDSAIINSSEETIEKTDTVDEQDLSDYYKQLQELK